MSRHVGILFRCRQRGVVHISESAATWRGPTEALWYTSLCLEISGAQYRGGKKPMKVTCKKCQRAAESIAAAIGWQRPLAERLKGLEKP